MSELGSAAVGWGASIDEEVGTGAGSHSSNPLATCNSQTLYVRVHMCVYVHVHVYV